MNTIILRKLNYKSKLNFGRYENLTIQEIIDLHQTKYLRWIYYNINGITFIDEILNRINILKNDRINKPRKNPQLGLKIDELLKHYSHMTNMDIRESNFRKKNKYTSFKNRDKKLFSKGALQRKNHGKF